MRIFKNTKRKIEWNSWKTKNRELEIRETIDELAPWIQYQEEENEEKNGDRWENINNDFGMEEMYRALNGIKKITAPGRDGIDYKMLRLLPKEGRRILLILTHFGITKTYRRTGIDISWYRYVYRQDRKEKS